MTPGAEPAHPVRLALLIALAFAVAVLPTLTWLEFSSGSENLLVATVIESHARARATGGHAIDLVPTLNAAPRLRKPPLPTWVSAALLPKSAVGALDSPDPLARDAAYRRLALLLRLPPLLFSALIVLLAFDLGRTVADARTGLLAALVAASSLLLLRYGRSATTDIQLAFWVTATNVCLARAMFRETPWPWLPLAGLAAGLGFMSKGPVGLAQSVLPAAFFWILHWRASAGKRRSGEDSQFAVSWSAAGGLLLGVTAFLSVAVPWYAYVAATTPDVWAMWKAEVTRAGATSLRADPPWAYIVITLMLAPWTVFFVAGLALAAAEWKARPERLFAVLAVAVPVLVMSLVKDKNERYLLPLVAPAAVLAAYALRPQLSGGQSRTDASLRQIHRLLLCFVAIGVPVSGAIASLQPGGEAWWGWGFAAAWAAGLCVVSITLNSAYERRRWMLPAATAGLMLAAHGLFLWGYRGSMNGRSEMRSVAEVIRSAAPPAAEVWYVDLRADPKPLPQDLQIYVNRVVRVATRPEQVPPASGNRVIVMLRRERDSAPTLEGFVEVAQRPWGARTWHVLLPAGP